jgi:hypothetical protein
MVEAERRHLHVLTGGTHLLYQWSSTGPHNVLQRRPPPALTPPSWPQQRVKGDWAGSEEGDHARRDLLARERLEEEEEEE